MTPKDIEEATKKVRSQKPKEGFITVQVSVDWNTRLILPHSDGVALMEALKNAEACKHADYEKSFIGPLETSVLTIAKMSAEEYEHRKIAMLLDVSYRDFLEAKNSPPF